MPLAPDPACFFRRLRTQRGLYLLGAGASTGEVAFGTAILRNPLLDYLRNARGFSATAPKHRPLSQLVLEAGIGITSFDIDGRTLAPGTEDITPELLRRVPANFPRSHILHQLAVARYLGRASHNYLPFRFAPPSLFMNYNHDGLASDLLGDIHPVVPVHDYVEPWIGSPEALNIIRTAGIEYDLAIADDRLLLMEPESYLDDELALRLVPMARFRSDFIAIIGYSFAWTGARHNDAVSLDCLIDHHRHFNGTVFIIDPEPWRLQELLAGKLHSAQVVGLPARWNLLAHAFLEGLEGRLHGRTLNDYCKALFDAGHGAMAFPLSPEPADRPGSL